MNSVEKIKELILNNEEAKKEFEEITTKSQKDFADAIATLASKYDIVLMQDSRKLSEKELASISGGIECSNRRYDPNDPRAPMISLDWFSK